MNGNRFYSYSLLAFVVLFVLFIGIGGALCSADEDLREFDNRVDMTLVADTTEETLPEDSPLAVNMNAFAVGLYREIGRDSENVIFSPGSISVALSMLSVGAGGDTRAEILKSLRTKGDGDALHEAIHGLLEDWKATGGKDGFKLNMVNRLFGQKGYKFKNEFMTLTRDQYGAELGAEDFTNQTELARNDINSWVADQTAQRIKELLPQGSLSPATRLVLVNAVYFKAKWNSPFKKIATGKGDFSITEKEKVKVSFMHQKGFFGYAETDDAQALEMQYKESPFSMVVVLPKKIDGLANLEKSLTGKDLQNITAKISHSEVNVTMPKFKLETPSIAMTSILKKLGIERMFSGKADFSGISDEPGLCISDVFHKAFIEVDEQGTEAAAATGMAAVGAAAPMKEPPSFHADHPFLFFIRDMNSGMILFMGRLQRPK